MATYKHNNIDNRRRARFLLEKLRPEAVARADEADSSEMSEASDLFTNTSRHLHIDRVTGVHVYQGEKRGWFADLTFKDLPAGVPPIIGTPTVMPHSSREEAIAQAVGMLTMLITLRRTTPLSDEDAKAIFPFDEVLLEVPSRMIEYLRAVPGRPSNEDIVKRLEEIRNTFGGGRPLTVEVMNLLPEEDQVSIVAVAAMAMAAGFVRYPLRDEEAPHPSMRH